MDSIFSFFTGAGFLDLGFEHAGFRVDMVNEWDPTFLRGYRHSRGVLGSPEPIYGHHLGSAEEMASPKWRKRLKALVAHARSQGRRVGFVGGPPCPDFSFAGKNAGGTGDNGRLTSVYFDVIRQVKPDFFVFENVEGLWRTRIHRQYYDDQKLLMEDAGYLLNDRLVNAIAYGAPQDRSRIFLVGTLDGNPDVAFPWSVGMEGSEAVLRADWPKDDEFVPGVPTPFHGREGTVEELTVEHWFRLNDVATHPNASMFFQAKSEKIQRIREGSTDSKSFKRLHRWRYSPTACYGHNEVHLHPYEGRRISVAEALALQSLPREYELPRDMTLSAAFKTIGNGVPYLAAKGLATSIAAFLELQAAAPRPVPEAAAPTDADGEVPQAGIDAAVAMFRDDLAASPLAPHAHFLEAAE